MVSRMKCMKSMQYAVMDSMVPAIAMCRVVLVNFWGYRMSHSVL